jgi:cold shock CspA family protein
LEGIDFDALEEGNSVEFNVERGPRGPRAVNVRMIKA